MCIPCSFPQHIKATLTATWLLSIFSHCIILELWNSPLQNAGTDVFAKQWVPKRWCRCDVVEKSCYAFVLFLFFDFAELTSCFPALLQANQLNRNWMYWLLLCVNSIVFCFSVFSLFVKTWSTVTAMLFRPVFTAPMTSLVYMNCGRHGSTALVSQQSIMLPKQASSLWAAHDPALHVSAPLSSALLSTAPNVSVPPRRWNVRRGTEQLNTGQS